MVNDHHGEHKANQKGKSLNEHHGEENAMKAWSRIKDDNDVLL